MLDKTLLTYLTKARRALHQIPEIGFELHQTSAFIQKELKSMGYEPIVMAKTGVIAIKPGQSKHAIAFRADMDALNVTEQTQVDFKSGHDGQMHACGHDAHMAMLLAFAKSIASLQPFKHSVVFVFQPAEEGPGGAKIMIDEGLIERFHITKIFGLHVFPGLPEGTIGLADGPMMAQSLELEFTVQGKSAHAAEPHEGIDALVGAAQLILAVQGIVSRNIDPLETAVITLGTISGGEAPNILPQSVTVKGTARGFSPDVMSLVRKRLSDICEGVALSSACTISAKMTDTYPAVINDGALFKTISGHLTCPHVIVKPKMFAEDFSYYQKKVPGLFAFVGTRNEALKLIHPLHSCYFNLNEEALLTGVDYYTQVLSMMD